MRHIQFESSTRHSVALLVKGTAFKQHELEANYVNPLISLGIPRAEMIAFTLDYDEKGKAPVTHIKSYLGKLLPALDSLGVQTLYVTDAAFFKTLTKQDKADPHFGYVLPCKMEGFEHLKVVLGLNYQQLIYNPDLQAKLDLSLKTLASHMQGTYQALGANIIHSAQYPATVEEIKSFLEALHKYPVLSADIETTSLSFWEAELESISFAWNCHEGGAFCIGRDNTPEDKKTICSMLKVFFELYTGTLIWHNIDYDAKVLTYRLWMSDYFDIHGMLEGINVLTKNFHDTKLITFLATNSTAGNSLGLKEIAHEFAGDYGVL